MKKLIYFLLFIVFDSYAQSSDCYEVVEPKSNIGISSYYNSSLNDKACELKNIITTASNTIDLKIVGFDLYPIAAYYRPEESFPYLFEKAKESLDAVPYIMISKEHHENGEIKYRSHIRFPSVSHPSFDQFNEIQKETIKREFQLALENAQSSIFSPEAEINALDYFIEVLAGGLQETDFISAGFEELSLNESYETLRISQTSVIDSLDNRYYDYGGIFISENTQESRMIDIFSQYIPKDEMLFSVILTNNVHNQHLNQAGKRFERDKTNKVIVWMHFETDPNLSTDNPIRIYVKAKNNFTYSEADNVLGQEYASHLDTWIGESDNEGPVALRDQDNYRDDTCNCTPSWEWGKNCVVNCTSTVTQVLGPGVDLLEFDIGIVAGVLDGLLGTINFIYSAVGGGINWMQKMFTSVKEYAEKLYETYKREQSFVAVMDQIGEDIENKLSEYRDKVVKIWNAIEKLAEDPVTLVKAVAVAIKQWFVTTLSEAITLGYEVGKIVFEVITAFFSGGTSVAATAAKKFLPKILSLIDEFGDANKISKWIKKTLDSAELPDTHPETLKKVFKCKILGKGCFVEDTPVLMAHKNYNISFGNTAKAMAVAASMPIVAVPIQEVQLLDYAVAHETVNATYGMIASTDDDIYLGLIDKDPYTSDQQRERDEYEINDTDWNEVVFKEVHGGSTAKLALHNDWINQKGYQVDAVVEMNLPEQGISGPFRITSIKHIIPQKKPVDDDEADEYSYRPVTGLFIHEASDVWRIKFDNGEELGVTHKHPIYSATKGDWELAGELEIGEEVLTKSGGAKVVSKEIDQVQEVYNLEVKDYHNFLVNASGIVVHNTGNCFKEISDLYKRNGKSFKLPKEARRNYNVSNPNKHWFEIEEIIDGQPVKIPFSKNGYPDFENPDWYPGADFKYVSEALDGDNVGNLDFGPAYQSLKDKFANNPNVKISGKSGGAFDIEIDGVKKRYTWHHHEDGKTMMPVLQSVHNKTKPHTGGASLIKIENGAYKGLFDSPN